MFLRLGETDDRHYLTDYGEGIIESDILSDGDESSSELVPSELLTEAAFGFTATILCGGEDAIVVVTVGITMGETERLSGLVASRILVAVALAARGGCATAGGGVAGPQMDTTGGLEDGVRMRGVGEAGDESEAVVAADAVRR